MLQGYFDSSFVADSEDRNSTPGSLLLYNSIPISWLSKNKSTVELLTTKEEYIALLPTAQTVDSLYLKISYMMTQCGAPVFLKTDNQSARDIFTKPFGTNR